MDRFPYVSIPPVDAKLRRELAAIARDNRSGAAELALQAVSAVQAWLRRVPDPGKHQLIEVGGFLLRVHPEMASFVRLANELALASGGQSTIQKLERALSRLGGVLTTAPRRIAAHDKKALSKETEPVRVVTYSFSSTVLGALIASRKHIREVVCPESRPGEEGYQMAAALAHAGIRVWLRTDVESFCGIIDSQVVMVGADSVLKDGFMNKEGTHVLSACAADLGARFWVLTDTSKFLPQFHVQYWLRKDRAFPTPRGRSLWKSAPRGVDSFSMDGGFDLTDFSSEMRFLTEKGWMTPARVRRELKKIRISPRLKTLVD